MILTTSVIHAVLAFTWFSIEKQNGILSILLLFYIFFPFALIEIVILELAFLYSAGNRCYVI